MQQARHAHALEDHVGRAAGDLGERPGHIFLRRVDGAGGAERQRGVAPDFGELANHHLEGAGQFGEGHHRQADRPATDHQDPVAELDLALLDRVQADRERLDGGALPRADPFGKAQRLRRADVDILRKAARHFGRIAGDPVVRAEDAELVFAFLQAARAAAIAGIVGHGGHQFADLPAGRAGLDDLAGELVSEHRAGSYHERTVLRGMQVRSADAAIVDFEDQTAGLGFRVGHVADLQRLADPVEYGCTHHSPPANKEVESRAGEPHWRAVVPPSMVSTLPLQYEDSSLAR